MSGAETKTEVFTVTEMVEPVEEKDMSSTNKKRCTFEQYVQPCLAELFGTSLFVFVGCASAIGTAATAGVTQPAVVHGLAVGVLIMMFEQISGGHFNPVVSLSAYLCGGMKFPLLVPYVLAQILGGMIGAFLAKMVYPSNVYATSLGGAFSIDPSDLGRATMAEAILTLFLITVVCMGAINSQTRSPLTGFFVGLTVTAAILAGGTVSGACMNPARAFGPAVVANHWSHHWVYWVGPICGALLSVAFSRLLFGDRKTRVVFK